MFKIIGVSFVLAAVATVVDSSFLPPPVNSLKLKTIIRTFSDLEKMKAGISQHPETTQRNLEAIIREAEVPGSGVSRSRGITRMPSFPRALSDRVPSFSGFFRKMRVERDAKHEARNLARDQERAGRLDSGASSLLSSYPRKFPIGERALYYNDDPSLKKGTSGFSDWHYHEAKVTAHNADGTYDLLLRGGIQERAVEESTLKLPSEVYKSVPEKGPMLQARRMEARRLRLIELGHPVN